ncbi:hypothetical protein CHS0354_028168 [Potamilus streckersoni]|uniref:Uncharacterized protein n=1 Tax=Potamilus streckersoni TaxID=2493646 RepID=A0AAE0WE19_9BIVA|nr:hypothetical protein CHS0354_028168 [Potamilus streckersoni]
MLEDFPRKKLERIVEEKWEVHLSPSHTRKGWKRKIGDSGEGKTYQPVTLGANHYVSGAKQSKHL